MARWSSPKDPALEAALRRNRRWVVNNQIKRLLLRFPSRTAPVRFLQSRFKTLDLMGRAANWLRKYPSCFEVFSADAGGFGGGGEQELHFGFTKRMAALVDAEEAAVAASEPAMVDRLARVLMLARGRRLQVSKLAALRGPLGLPDDYLLRLLPALTDIFRLANPYPQRRRTGAHPVGALACRLHRRVRRARDGLRPAVHLLAPGLLDQVARQDGGVQLLALHFPLLGGVSGAWHGRQGREASGGHGARASFH